MKHTIRLTVLVWLTAVPLYLCAQKGDPQPVEPDTTAERPVSSISATAAENSYKPNVIPPSPDAASLGRYGEIPVELSKGTPSISISLYEIQSGSLRLPISLSYHASGVRVNDVSTSVGTSWTLNAGGAITRAVNGLPDEFNGGFRTATFPKENDYNAYNCFIGRLAAFDGTQADGSSDIYYYNYNQNSGKYMFANRKSSQDLYFIPVPVAIPYKPIKIIPNGTIIEADGTLYSFGNAVNGKISYETSYVTEGPVNFTSTWYLSHMISANKIDTIYFEYTAPVGVNSLPLWSTTVAKNVRNGMTTSYDLLRSFSLQNTMTVYPAAIYFRNGKVIFTYAADREDLPGSKRLTAVYVYKKDEAGNYTELKHFDLGQSYFSCVDGGTQADQYNTATHTVAGKSHLLKRLRLDKVTEKNPANGSIPPHQFTYYETTSLKLPIYGSFAQDFWGFYNGESSNQHLLPVNPNGSAANRNTNFTYTVLGSLKDVTYPTGGKSVFVYEPHASGSAPGEQGGGIRIQSITNYENSSQLTKKKYTYTHSYITNNIYAGNLGGLGASFTSTVEQVVGGNCTNIDRIATNFYQEGYNFMLGSNSGSSMEYGTVEESLVDQNENPLGKTVRKFKQATDNTSSLFPFVTVSNAWMRGHLEEEKVFNSNNSLVKQTNNYYTTVYRDSLIRGFGAKPMLTPAIGSYGGGGTQTCILAYPSYCGSPDPYTTTAHRWWSSYFDYSVGSVFMDSTITTTFNETGSSGLSEQVHYTYASATHQQVTKQIVTGSKGQLLETNYKYPHELASSNADYQEMVFRHIYTPVIEQESKVAGGFQSLVKTNYKKWYSTTTYGAYQGFFAPLSIEKQEVGGALILQLVFGEKLTNPTENGYDTNGHPVVFTELNGTVTRLSWWQQAGKLDQINVQNVNGLFVTTYDYNPLIGIKSVTDPNNITRYYEYDAFNRLKNIRNDDASGAIRVSYCYNYAGQIYDCGTIVTTGVIAPVQLFLSADKEKVPLPVTLINFIALKFSDGISENSALLTWITSSETNSERFDVERSQNGKHWIKIGSVSAHGASAALQYYSMKDNSPLPGENLYRLKMIDKDNSFAYSRIESLIFDTSLSIYPNPLPKGEKLNLNIAGLGIITNVSIYDVSGRTMYSGKPQNGAIDMSLIPTGAYIVQITANNGLVTTHRIVTQ